MVGMTVPTSAVLAFERRRNLLSEYKNGMGLATKSWRKWFREAFFEWRRKEAKPIRYFFSRRTIKWDERDEPEAEGVDSFFFLYLGSLVRMLNPATVIKLFFERSPAAAGRSREVLDKLEQYTCKILLLGRFARPRLRLKIWRFFRFAQPKDSNQIRRDHLVR